MDKTLFKNAQIATSRQVFPGSLLVQGERIAAIFREGEELPPTAGTTVIDADGLVLLPGGVDAHTHFDLDTGAARASDDFHTGTIAAACGGTTTIIDHMAFGPKGAPLTHQPAVYHQLAQKSVIDYGFHGVLQHVDAQVLHDMQTLRDDEGIQSLKLYLTYDYMLQDDEVLAVLQRAKQLGLVVCAHCENNAIVNDLRAQFVQQGHTQAAFHPLSRPPMAEGEAIFRFLALAKTAGSPQVYIVHLSSAMGLQALNLAKRLGAENVAAETCPQYLFLFDELYDDPHEGLKYIMSPPLRKPADADALWQALADGKLQTIGTDHCPFFFATQKQQGAQNFTLCPNGAPGVELRMTLLFSEGYQKGRLTLPQMVQLCCTNPAAIFGLAGKKGDIAPGADADLVLFDPAARWTVEKSLLHENVDYTPYQGMALQGRPVLTMARGRMVAQQGRFVGEEGYGRYLRRKALQL